MRASRAWRWLGGLLLLVLVVRAVGSGPVLDGLRALDLRVVLHGVVLAVVTTVASAWRWTLVARELGVGLRLTQAVAACYRAQLLNTVLPGEVLGDVHRGMAHGRATGETGRALRAVGWERFAGQVVQALLAVLVLAVFPSPVRAVLPWLVLVVALGTAVAVVVLRSTPDRGTRWSRAAQTVRDDVRLALLVRRAWPGVVAASVVATAGHVATLVLAARAVGVDASLATVLPLAVAVLVAAALPLNVAGWGPREGMAAGVFAAAGLGAATGVATAVAYGAIVLVANLPGLVVLVAGPRATPLPAPAPGAAHA